MQRNFKIGDMVRRVCNGKFDMPLQSVWVILEISDDGGFISFDIKRPFEWHKDYFKKVVIC